MNLAAPPHVLPDVADDKAYRLVSVESAHAPEGCPGRDWFVYRIAQGANDITGYRRGNSETVRAEAQTIVIALNERREWKKRKQHTKGHRGAAAAARPAGAE